MLSPYRVLDLTDHRGEIAGMILACLGADVIKIEPRGGCPGRRQPPFAGARGLQFDAFNRNKRSIELDLGDESARREFFGLVARADIVLESHQPGSRDPDLAGALVAAGIDFDALRGANPFVVHVRITPFGCDGPRAEWLGSDLVIAAMGGPVALQGSAARAPVRISVPQAWRHAGAEAAVAALVGLRRMQTCGEAQLVDLSAQCAMTWTLLNAMDTEAIQGHDFQRYGSTLQLGGINLPLVYECADGYVVVLATGAVMARLLPLMLADGTVDDQWRSEDWSTWDARLQMGEAVSIGFDELLDAYRRWLRGQTKRRLLVRGLEVGVSIAPVNTLADALAFDQLAVREFWDTRALRAGREVRMPGAFARPSVTPLAASRPAPAVNEHAGEVRAILTTPVPQAPVIARAELPFAGLKVADFSWVGVGPISAKYLADHGATVVRVESEGRPDVLRVNGPFKDGVPGLDRSQFYGDFNTSKLGLQLDLKQSAACDVARRLLAWADVCIESFTPGTMDDLGIGYRVAQRLNPAIIMVSTCLMGQTGPIAPFAGYGYHAAAVAGFFELTGWPDLPPDGPWVAYTDTIAPRFVAATLIAALDHRARTGEGQHIDGAQLEMGLHFLAPEIAEYQLTGRLATRAGNRSRFEAPQGVYRCLGDDRWCAIAVDTDEQWRALCGAIGRDDWLQDTTLASHGGRLLRHDELDAGIEAWTAVRDRHVVAETLQGAGVPAGVPQLSADLLRDPQYRHRGFYRYFEHPEMGHIPYAGHQFRIAGYDNGPRGPAPCLGQHLHDVLSGLLGLGDDEIADLIAAGAVG